jgi:hypothetical protein
MSTFAPVALPHIAPPDPSKHVNYQLGMVLGVDDFKAEFTYLSDRMRRIVRDLIGYGVVSGLHVTVGSETDERGPRLQVSPGGLVTPSGQLVCVSPAQCAYLNEWLRANREAVETLFSSPPSVLELAVVACYRECETDDVPIPGEPCRSEDELMKPSRMQDFFALELRFDAPAQAEDDAVREFVAWIRQIPVVDDTPPADTAAFVAALETATAEVDSSPSAPLGFLAKPPPPTLAIPRAAYGEYLETLFAFWVTRLRARARSGPNAAECGCCGGPGELDPGAECLRIATVRFPIAPDLSGELLVADATKIVIDESMRPHLLHLRLLQEWTLTMPAATEPPAAVTPPAAVKPPVSGFVRSDGEVLAAVGGLEVKPVDDNTLFYLNHPGFDPTVLQLVSGQPLAHLSDKAPSTFEVIDREDTDLIALLGGSVPDGVFVRVQTHDGKPVAFTVRIEASEGTL